MHRFAFITIIAALLSISACAEKVSDDSKASYDPKAIEDSCGAANVEEAVKCLRNALSEEDHLKVMSETFEGTAKFHITLGLWIRNSWGLWSGKSKVAEYFNKNGIFHPDDMSGIIVSSYWLYHKDCPLELEKQFDYYKSYWAALEASEKNENETELQSDEEFQLDCTKD